ncbi:uncharacterized protein A1O9_10975 [Exophiala aquamarina CBS 119918]|uniref:Uncharacterized protein n=1 Tax=Exophiala aquamarina CBS 119918 TaxID=1182545 RepID=A0A072P065_9EURO|nr:uncharacterized protein A1O9_10975 [Exophiala aquamarina CBS 119918]KEF53067.1 hypothetical protein A1O9_10975 [Exophiala aquamarina CBS 119918]
MLGDNPEKSKNPLKKAMRRRNAKTVQFAAPTYYEPSDYEYSDEEEEGDDSQLDQGTDENDDDDADSRQEADREPQAQQNAASANGIQRMTSNDSLKSDLSSTSSTKAQQQDVATVEQNRTEDAVSRSRKGVVRNTDSFFRDDTVETKKISLTPRLLRGDSESGQSAEQEVRQRQSLDTFDKVVGAEEKLKDKDKDKDKKKEKKGMLSGLFKRKKGSAPQEEREERPSEELRQSPQSKDSMESVTFSKPDGGLERKPSKLQKTPPMASPKSSPTEARAPQRDVVTAPVVTPPALSGPAPAPPTLRKVESESELAEDLSSTTTQNQPTGQVNRFPSLTEKRSIFAPITTALKSTSSANAETSSPVKPIYSKRAKERFAIDDSGSEDDGHTPKAEDQDRKSISPLAEGQDEQSRSDSSIRVSPIESIGPINQQARQETTMRSTPLPIETSHAESEGTASTSKPSPSTATHTPSTSRSTPTWSDASLRSYMENDQDIKDLLIIVHDKSNITPVGADHPLMSNLFSIERSKLAEMQSQLDSMLMTWMGKKNSNLLSATS